MAMNHRLSFLGAPSPETELPVSSGDSGVGLERRHLVRRFKTLKPSHKGGPPQTVVRGGTCVNRRGYKMN
eukprot:SAG25_NODE_403_length_8470_cov_48.785506_2_plen_70_part_00